MNLRALTAFLYQASMPHAFGTSNATRMPDDSTTITFQQGDWTFHDNFFGGRPYGGRVVIHYQQKPVWLMVYYGDVCSTKLGPNVVYDFLRLALQHAPKDKPHRGPSNFTRGELTYRNKLEGDIASYTGREVIVKNGQEIYWATYLGGLVDQDPKAGF